MGLRNSPVEKLKCSFDATFFYNYFMNLEVYTLSQDYIDYLSKFDKRICWTKGDLPFGRKYVGILLEINNVSYFAPLTSSIWEIDRKTKKPILDKNGEKIRKNHFTDVYLKDRHGKYIGGIKINNMIPVDLINNKNLLNQINISELIKSDSKTINDYGNLLSDQREALNTLEKQAEILEKANRFRRDYKLISSLSRLCCDFELLEDKALKYEPKKEKQQKRVKGSELGM